MLCIYLRGGDRDSSMVKCLWENREVSKHDE